MNKRRQKKAKRKPVQNHAQVNKTIRTMREVSAWMRHADAEEASQTEEAIAVWIGQGIIQGEWTLGEPATPARTPPSRVSYANTDPGPQYIQFHAYPPEVVGRFYDRLNESMSTSQRSSSERGGGSRLRRLPSAERHELITHEDLHNCERNWQADPDDDAPRRLAMPILRDVVHIAMEKRLRRSNRAAVFAGFAVEKAAGKPVVSAAEHRQWMIDNEQAIDEFRATEFRATEMGWHEFWCLRGEPVGGQ